LTLNQSVPQLVDRLQRAPELENVSTNYLDDGLSAFIAVDRDTAARFGVTAATIDNALYDAFGQRIVSTIFTQSNQYRVILEADPAVQNSLASLATIYLPSAGGGQVPLSAIAKVEERTGPLEVDHLGQFPAALISFDVAPGASLGAAFDAIGRRTEVGVRPPSPPNSVRRFPIGAGQWAALILCAVVRTTSVACFELHPRLRFFPTLPSARA
jgi:multidrug efflux pump